MHLREHHPLGVDQLKAIALGFVAEDQACDLYGDQEDIAAPEHEQQLRSFLWPNGLVLRHLALRFTCKRVWGGPWSWLTAVM